MFDTLLIIGGGLIGSSIARAARANNAASRILMSDTSMPACEAIKRLGIADDVSENATDFAAEADLIILCVPPGQMGGVAASIGPLMKDGAVLSDVGSVKGHIIEAVQPHVKDSVEFVPAHPISGTEYNGPEAGFATLFTDRWCILTPEDETNPAAIKLSEFWKTLGSNPVFMTPERHDIVLATTSHVPHLIAYTLVRTAQDMERVTNKDVVKFSAGGFRDFTRIAASDPIMWRDVFLNNRKNVLEVVDRFIEDLSALKRAIRWDDGEHIFDELVKARDVRESIIDAGQDSAAPNFGRNES
ncbi:MAG: prephenate/arogenate dehydrogenase family protein [Maricaulaceae bacterium]